MVKFLHSTPAQNAAVLRERFRQAGGITAARIARWILRNLTDAQIKVAFGLTNPQLAALKTRLQAKADILSSVELARGE